MRNHFYCVLFSMAIVSFSSTARAEKVEITRGVNVTKTTYSVPSNEAPFFNFAEKTVGQKEADEHFIAEILKRVPDRSKAAQAARGAGWQALIARGDFGTAAKRFNQTFLLN